MRKSGVSIISGIVGIIIGGLGVSRVFEKQLLEKSGKVDKFKSYYSLLNQWMILKNEERSLEEYFLKKGYKTIAIYGMGEIGNRFYEDLRKTEIKVLYGIDKESSTAYSELPVVSIDEIKESVDIIVVTAIFAFEEIYEELKNRTEIPIISLEEIIYSI